MKIVVKSKVTLADIYVVLLAVWLFTETIVTGTTFDDNIALIFNQILNVLWVVFRLFVVAKILFEFDKGDIKLIVLILLSFVSTYFSSGYWVSEVIWVIVGFKHVDIHKAVKAIFIAELIGFIMIFGLSLVGYLPDTISTRSDGTIRHAYGFNHANAFAARVLQLTALFITLKGSKLKKKHLLVLCIVTFAVLKITDSKTTIFLMLITILFVFVLSGVYSNRRQRKLGHFWERLISKLKYLVFLIPILATVVMFQIAKLSGDSTLISRASQIVNYFQYYGLTLFGQPLEINTGADNFYLQLSSLYTLDSGYMYLLLGYGTIFFVLFICAEIYLVYRYVKTKRYTMAVILILYMIYGITETMMIRLTYNFSLIFLSEVLWRKSWMWQSDYSQLTEGRQE